MIGWTVSAAVSGLAGIYISAAAWGAQLSPFHRMGDRLFLLIPGQLLTIAAVLCAFLAAGFSISDMNGWLSAVLTHGGP